MAEAPEWPRTVHCIGDLHAGAITDARMDAVSADVRRLGTPALHVQLGDATERGTDAEDELALRFLERLCGDWVCALGNHDILGNSRTVDTWAHAYGQESQNLSVDLSFVRVVVVGPDRNEPGPASGLLSQDTLEFLDTELEGAPTDCWIACHWPLFGTVMGDPRLHYTSAMAAFHAKPDDRIRELLAGRPNARAWISGHTHSPIEAPGFVGRVRLAPGRSITTINASALVGVGRTRDPRAPLCSVYLTHHADRIEVRCRDHGAGRWRGSLPSCAPETYVPTEEGDHMAFEDEEKRADEETLPDTSLHAYGEGREEDVEGDSEKLESSDPETSQREEISEGDDGPQMPEQPKE